MIDLYVGEERMFQSQVPEYKKKDLKKSFRCIILFLNN